MRWYLYSRVSIYWWVNVTIKYLPRRLRPLYERFSQSHLSTRWITDLMLYSRTRDTLLLWIQWSTQSLKTMNYSNKSTMNIDSWNVRLSNPSSFVSSWKYLSNLRPEDNAISFYSDDLLSEKETCSRDNSSIPQSSKRFKCTKDSA